MSDPEPYVSLEYETTVSSRGIAPANAVVEQIDGSTCRLRTIVLFDLGDTIEFFLRRNGNGEVTVRGTVAARESKGHRFAYVMHLDRMSAKEIDALGAVLDDLDGVATGSGTETEPAAPDGLMRCSARVPANFDVTYRTPAFDFKPAKAIDISRSGMMMSCVDMLVPGVPVEIRLTLPGQQSSGELTLGARVVTRQEACKGTFLYGLALTRVNDSEYGRLERYVNAASQSRP